MCQLPHTIAGKPDEFACDVGFHRSSLHQASRQMTAMVAKNIATKSAKDPHRGDKTHHQLQLITPKSRKVMNTTQSSPGNPMADKLTFTLGFS